MAVVSYGSYCLTSLSARCVLQVIVILNQQSKEYFISPCHYKKTEGLDVKTDFSILPRVSEAFQKTSFLEVHFYM